MSRCYSLKLKKKKKKKQINKWYTRFTLSILENNSYLLTKYKPGLRYKIDLDLELNQ